MQGSNKQAVAITAMSTAAAAAPRDQHHSERSTRSRARWFSNVRHKRLAVIPALAALAVLAAPVASASAAATLTGETLSGTATTTSGSAWGRCGWWPGMFSVGASFDAAGAATGGHYDGSFVTTQGSARLFRTVMHNQFSYFDLGVPFTITSGTTTITGGIIHVQSTLNPSFLGGFGQLCNGLTVAGLTVSTTASYTATVQVGDGAPQPIGGQATVSGRLYAQPGAQGSLKVIFG